MRCSTRQTEVWKAREELDRKLADMTPQEIIEYADGAVERARARTGRELKLRVADASPDTAVETNQ
ncbi:MAG: hypothetical protein WBF17_24770 [Phycisphaerae bacterium]